MATTSPSAPPAASPLGRRTTPTLWLHALAQGWHTPAYLEERADGWREVSWQEAGERVDALAQALQARGVRRGDAVAVLARTRLEWVLLDWAAMTAGAVVVGLYPTSTAAECAYILRHAEATLAFVEDDDQYAKLVSARSDLPALREIVRFDELPRLEREGRARDVALPDDAHENDLATLIYTSGTTGPPKGCMLTHRNLVAAAVRVRTRMESERDGVLLFLPLAHSFGRLCHQSAAYRGTTLALCADVARVPEALLAVRPTILPAVPRVYEKVHANVIGEIERSGAAKRAIGRWALGLGGRLRLGISGAAPLGQDVLEFFHALGMLVIEGYGLTETASSLSVNDPDDFRFGTVGRAVEGCEVALAEDGEILVRSDTVFAGYYKDPDATSAAFTEDGWFRTGDVGELDEDGFVKITDRKKDLIITAGGKNVAPQNLENALKASRFVSQTLVIGDRRPYLTALVTLAWDEVDASRRDARELVQELVDDVNATRSRVEQIKRFAILPRDFSQEEGELTPTLKLRRRVVEEHFADEIERLYV
jgi:long-chain acyl-CoA synthetase